MGGTGGTGTGGGGGLTGGEDCPRKFEAIVADVIQTGNENYALAMNPGDKLELSVVDNDGAVVIIHEDTKIGFLPPQRLNIIQCIEQGWTYSASVVEASGNKKNPRIKILVVGVPG